LRLIFSELLATPPLFKRMQKGPTPFRLFQQIGTIGAAVCSLTCRSLTYLLVSGGKPAKSVARIERAGAGLIDRMIYSKFLRDLI
jgi:hypothetical protein